MITVCCCLTTSVTQTKSDEITSIKYNYMKADFENIRQELNIDWKEVFVGKDTIQMVDTFMEKLTTAMDRHIPKKRVA